MLEEWMERLEGVPATVISGIFLVLEMLPFFDFLPISPAWVSVLISGLPLLYSAIRKLFLNRGISKISSALLISVAMIAAVAIGDVFAAGEVAFIMAIGEILEEKTTARARRGLQKLIGLAPTKGRRIRDGKEELIAAEEIQVGDLIRVLPGETIPVDGAIVSGETSIDQSVMTGESLPVDKTVGDSVFGGTLNRFGVINVRASKVGEDSSLHKLIRMVQDAEEKKAPTERVMDRWASYLVPIAFLLAIVAGLIKQDLVVAVTVLVVFCPCALVLATPTAIMAAIGQATRHGVIIKSGEALEKMGRADTIAFDKTGTLTYGKPEVSDVISFGMEADELLALVASAESKSEHPLGRAIVEQAKSKTLPLVESDAFRMIAGRGIVATVGEVELYCGNDRFLAENGIALSEKAASQLEALRNQGKASVIAATKGGLKGIIALSDSIKPDAGEMVQQLRQTGTKAVLLTGDNHRAAMWFADQAHITEVHADLLPEQKVEKVLTLQGSGRKVCMIGDGVNDAPALKTAEVGVAMGTVGSDIAVEAADIALMSDDLSKIPYLKRLSVATVKTIRLGIALSLLINALAIVLSFLNVLNPTTGALVHNAGSVFVVLIAAGLYDRKF